MKDKSLYLKPQDIIVLMKILALKGEPWSQMSLAKDLAISQSEISESFQRSINAGFIGYLEKSIKKLAFKEFLLHGLKYVFAVKPGRMVRGIPTAHSTPFFENEFIAETTYVWPYAKGEARGEAIEPLYKSVPEAVQKDPKLYKYLSLIELLRVGKVREQEFAKKQLEMIIDNA